MLRSSGPTWASYGHPGQPALALALALALQQRAWHSHTHSHTATHAVARAGHTVVPIDVGKDYCYDPDSDSPQVDAIMGVDMFGNMCNWSMLEQLGVPVLNDAAQSIESHNGVKYSAGYGDAACLSFSPSKTISSWGSGGAILTDNKRIADKAKKLRLHGKQTNNESAIHPGLNSMMSSFECACVLVGLEHSDEWQKRRHKIASYLKEKSPYACATSDLKMHTHSKSPISSLLFVFKHSQVFMNYSDHKNCFY